MICHYYVLCAGELIGYPKLKQSEAQISAVAHTKLTGIKTKVLKSVTEVATQPGRGITVNEIK